jgi:hypothetical protein
MMMDNFKYIVFLMMVVCGSVILQTKCVCDNQQQLLIEPVTGGGGSGISVRSSSDFVEQDPHIEAS